VPRLPEGGGVNFPHPDLFCCMESPPRDAAWQRRTAAPPMASRAVPTVDEEAVVHLRVERNVGPHGRESSSFFNMVYCVAY
jgi:hypothetical protein